MSQKVIFGILAVAGAALVVTFLLKGNMMTTPGSSPDNPIALPTGPMAGEVSLLGEAVCLPHKGNPEIVTMECAYGFKDTDGNYYGIRDTSSDVHSIAQLEMGASLRITGTFFPQEDEKYASIGIIEVRKIERAMEVSSEHTVLTGTFTCLPHKDTTGPQTEECAFGFETDDHVFYAVNFGASAERMEQFQSGMHGTHTGVVTPIEMLSTNHWQKYDIKGIFTITETGE